MNFLSMPKPGEGVTVKILSAPIERQIKCHDPCELCAAGDLPRARYRAEVESDNGPTYIEFGKLAADALRCISVGSTVRIQRFGQGVDTRYEVTKVSPLLDLFVRPVIRRTRVQWDILKNHLNAQEVSFPDITMVDYAKIERQLMDRMIRTCGVPAEMLGPETTNKVTVPPKSAPAPEPVRAPPRIREITKRARGERCHYHVPRDIKGAERIPVKEFARWQAPPDEQLRGITPELILWAQRNLVDVPVCNVDGKRVEIVVNIVNEWVAARLLCPRCSAADAKDDACEGQGKCHGSLKWCDECGDVGDMCDADAGGCDCHPVKENNV